MTEYSINSKKKMRLNVLLSPATLFVHRKPLRLFVRLSERETSLTRSRSVLLKTRACIKTAAGSSSRFADNSLTSHRAQHTYILRVRVLQLSERAL